MSHSEPIPNYLSLGAGVQSSTLALMAAHGEILPHLDGAVFSDTHAEPKSVYLWLDKLEQFIADAPYPFPVYRVSRGSLTKDVLTPMPRKDGNGYYIHSGIPAFTVHKVTGKKGIIPRQCTWNYKIEVLDKQSRAQIGEAKMKAWRKTHRDALKALSLYNAELALWRRETKANKKIQTTDVLNHQVIARPCPVRPAWAWDECQADPLIYTWIGISIDEWERKKDSRHPWAKFKHPLIEAEIDRASCLAWMLAKGYPKPPRSSCVYCPYHSDDEWRRLRDEEPEDFAAAIAFDHEFRRLKSGATGVNSVPYLHASRVPLDEVDFSTSKEKGQGELALIDSHFTGGCTEGMCGV